MQTRWGMVMAVSVAIDILQVLPHQVSYLDLIRKFCLAEDWSQCGGTPLGIFNTADNDHWKHFSGKLKFQEAARLSRGMRQPRDGLTGALKCSVSTYNRSLMEVANWRGQSTQC